MPRRKAKTWKTPTWLNLDKDHITFFDEIPKHSMNKKARIAFYKYLMLARQLPGIGKSAVLKRGAKKRKIKVINLKLKRG